MKSSLCCVVARLAKPRLKTAIVLVACLLAACEGDFMSWEPETPAEQSLRESREALERTVGEGALIGAAGGAAIGAALAGVGGGFQGARIGQLAGATAGNYVKALQAQYAQQEALIGAVTRDLNEANRRMEASIRAMRQSLAEKQARAAPDAVRDQRLAEEAQATLAVAERYNRLFGETRAILASEGAPVASLDDDLARLSNTVSTMRQVAGSLATDL